MAFEKIMDKLGVPTQIYSDEEGNFYSTESI